jgi:histidyl-tRNA synthetase
MAVNSSIPKGTRDFGPDEMARRNYIFDTIRAVFKLFGYLQIETPAMENLSTLMGKYGEEGDRLIFKILNSGDFMSGLNATDVTNLPVAKITNRISEKALRYDLTVPFARFVVMNQSKISFPFKRYQIQPVWRADRPQKGRYREFYQCDVDVIGSNSLINELELIQIINEVYKRLGLEVVIKVNNRKILKGIADVLGEQEKFVAIVTALDKIDKVGKTGVFDELRTKDISEDSIARLDKFIENAFEGNDKNGLLTNTALFDDSEAGRAGVKEMSELFNLCKNLNIDNVEFDFTLARGLNYYTGTIIEVKAKGMEFGSICGGGRYDDLTGIFGMPGVSGVGVSFGADRIYDVLLELNLFPEDITSAVKLMFVNFGGEEEQYALKILAALREAGLSAELYPDAAKMKKQMAYADNKKIAFVALAGSDEMKSGNVTLKDMKTGDQKKVSVDELMKILLS